MSFDITASNFNFRNHANGQHLRLLFPAGATDKPADTGFILGFWYQNLLQGDLSSGTPEYIFTRYGGASGGGDGLLRHNASAGSWLYYDAYGGALRANFSGGGALVPYSPTFVMLVATSTDFYLITCEVGGTPVISTDIGNADPYVAAASYGAMFDAIGGGTNTSSYPYIGAIENVFFLHGDPPTIDNAFVENIANGVTDISAISGLMTGGSLQYHYSLNLKDDFSDASGNFGDLTIEVDGVAGTEDLSAGIVNLQKGPLRPTSLMPRKIGNYGSPLKITSFGDLAGATADVHMEGGAYTGITPSAIEGRLRKEDGTVHVDWTVVDAAPSAGTWADSYLTDVPGTTGYLLAEFRAVDGAGAQIGSIVPSNGIRGTSLSVSNLVAQSQFARGFISGSGTPPLDSGARFFFARNGGQEGMVNGPATEPGRYYSIMMTFYANELNRLAPGYPVFFGTIAQGGEGLKYYLPDHPEGKAYLYERWQAMADYYNFRHDDCFHIFGGFLDDRPRDYEDYIARAMDQHETRIGTLRKAVYVQQPLKYENTLQEWNSDKSTDESYKVIRDTDKGFWVLSPSMLNVVNDGGPHATRFPRGEGRIGVQMARTVANAYGMLKGPVEIVSATSSGARQARLKVALANDPFTPRNTVALDGGYPWIGLLAAGQQISAGYNPGAYRTLADGETITSETATAYVDGAAVPDLTYVVTAGERIEIVVDVTDSAGNTAQLKTRPVTVSA